MLELLLSVALIGILAGMGSVVFRSHQMNNDLILAVSITGQSWRQAQMRSQAGDGDDTWGVYIDTGSITIFKGTDYASRDVTYDEDFSIGSNLSISGLTEVVFDLITGLPNVTGNITYTAPNNVTSQATINEAGLSSY